MNTGEVRCEHCRKGDVSGWCRIDSPVNLFEPVALFNADRAKVFKTGSKITAAVAGGVFVKCYFYRGIPSRCRHFFRVSRAESCFYNALKVRKAGVATPAPWGYLREHGLLFPHRDYLFTDVLPSETVFFDQAVCGNPEKAARQVARCAVKLHEAGIWHGDFSLRNLYETEEGEAGVIDLDSCRVRKAPLKLSERVSEIARAVSSAAKVTDRLSLAEFKEIFLDEYRKECNINLACPALEARAEYLFNRRRA